MSIRYSIVTITRHRREDDRRWLVHRRRKAAGVTLLQLEAPHQGDREQCAGEALPSCTPCSGIRGNKACPVRCVGASVHRRVTQGRVRCASLLDPFNFHDDRCCRAHRRTGGTRATKTLSGASTPQRTTGATRRNPVRRSAAHVAADYLACTAASTSCTSAVRCCALCTMVYA